MIKKIQNKIRNFYKSLFKKGAPRPPSQAASRLRKVLPTLVLPQQTARVEKRFIGESGILIADVIEITDIPNKEGFLVTRDIMKAFNSLDHTFVISVLKKFGFGNNFVSWIETLISKQESCVINDGKKGLG